MKRIYLIVTIILFTLPAIAQFTTMPSMAFQSTSTMAGSGSMYSSNPTLNSDGTATYNGAPSKGPRRAKMDDDDIEIVTPGQGGSQAPVGDALIPLFLMVMAYATFILLRRRRRA